MAVSGRLPLGTHNSTGAAEPNKLQGIECNNPSNLRLTALESTSIPPTSVHCFLYVIMEKRLAKSMTTITFKENIALEKTEFESLESFMLYVEE